MTQKLKFVPERVENIVGKGKNESHQHFLLFPQSFLPIQRRISDFNLTILSYADAFNLDQYKKLSLVKD